MATSAPSSDSERLLYRVLQRANLLPYYDTFVAQGGDDVTQLCEAGEEEFLEIMALVGMAAKPLHVRRLQKALQEWVTNPVLFLRPMGSATPPPPTALGSIVSTLGRPAVSAPQYAATHIANQTQGVDTQSPPQKAIVIAPITSPSRASPPAPSWNTTKPDVSSASCSPLPAVIENEVAFVGESSPMWKAGTHSNGITKSPTPIDMSSTGSISPTPSTGESSGIPQLSFAQRRSIEMAAEALVRDLPVYDMKPLSMKREYNRELMQVITMPDDHPDKMTLLRKYAAIYARFDSKRKNEGKMTLHEVSVNEAAAQLCRRIPALLTRRDDLYPLSRRVVRDSGYQYSKGHSRACSSIDIIINNKRAQTGGPESSPAKKPKIEPTGKATPEDFNLEKTLQDRVNAIHSELSEIMERQEELKSLITTARARQEWANMDALRLQLEHCAAKQLKLRMEQSAIIGSSKAKLKNTNISPNSRKSEAASGTNGISSSKSSRQSTTSPNSKSNTHSSATKHVTNSNGGHAPPKTSLVEEGLRIAQQYGMADFAQELMKTMSPQSDSDLDEQAEWNREVEQDMIQQKLVTPEKKNCEGEIIEHSQPRSGPDLQANTAS